MNGPSVLLLVIAALLGVAVFYLSRIAEQLRELHSDVNEISRRVKDISADTSDGAKAAKLLRRKFARNSEEERFDELG